MKSCVYISARVAALCLGVAAVAWAAPAGAQEDEARPSEQPIAVEVPLGPKTLSTQRAAPGDADAEQQDSEGERAWRMLVDGTTSQELSVSARALADAVAADADRVANAVALDACLHLSEQEVLRWQAHSLCNEVLGEVQSARAKACLVALGSQELWPGAGLTQHPQCQQAGGARADKVQRCTQASAPLLELTLTGRSTNLDELFALLEHFGRACAVEELCVP